MGGLIKYGDIIVRVKDRERRQCKLKLQGKKNRRVRSRMLLSRSFLRATFSV